ncbi:MAG: gliding motility protein GldL [Bacteroidaceae bacterium]|nr:gliding motility protein GldL [Bacteroidaceae bacterium]
MKQNTSAISRFQDFLETQKGQTILNYLYSWGAAVVILGALFKLTHIAGADLMLFLGMGTEVLTFIVNGFERQSSAKETAAPATASGPVIVGAPATAGAVTASAVPVAVGAVPAASVPVGTDTVGSNITVGSNAATAPQLDAETLNAMANIAAANAAVAAAQNMAQGTAQPVTAVASQPAVPVVDGKVDVPELQQVTQDYIEQLRALTESFQHIADQSSQLEASADEVERLSRNLTSINTIYEMHLKSLGSQIGNIDLVNEQTRRMAEQIEELNQVYDRMLQSMTVNMKVGRNADEQSKEA